VKRKAGCELRLPFIVKLNVLVPCGVFSTEAPVNDRDALRGSVMFFVFLGVVLPYMIVGLLGEGGGVRGMLVKELRGWCWSGGARRRQGVR
jgi:hypothetical protein